MDRRYILKDKKTLPIPNIKIYYLLQFSWGLILNVFGAIVSFILLCCSFKPYRYKYGYCFELPIDFGLNLGIFFLVPINGSEHTKDHEYGHSIQNMYFGPFSIGSVHLISAIRFWIRAFLTKIGKTPTTKYDDIWFEGQASYTGKQ